MKNYISLFNIRILTAIGLLIIVLSAPNLAYATASWTNITNMNVGRSNHYAIVLSSGEVLVGGNTALQTTSRLYDPGTGNWSNTGAMTDPRYFATINLVTISGGGERAFLAGGVNASGITNKTMLYNRASSGTWSNGPNMVQKRSQHTSSLLDDGTVLVAGGAYVSLNATRSAEIYDPINNSWSMASQMNAGRYSHTQTLLNDGRVLVTGGANLGSALTSTEIYDPSTNTWSNGPSMSYARSNHTATLLPNGEVLIAGGSSTAGTKAELFDPTTDTLSNAADMSYSHSSHTATLITVSGGGQNVLIAAGSGGSSAKAELYDPSTDTWTTTVDLNIIRHSHRANLLNNGTVLITGGIGTGGELDEAEYYTAP